MFTSELHHLFDAIVTKLSAENYLVQTIHRMATLQGEVLNALRPALSSNENTSTTKQTISNQIRGLKNVEVRRVWTELDSTMKILTALPEPMAQGFGGLAAELQLFSDCFELYVRNYEIWDAVVLFARAAALDKMIAGTRGVLASVDTALVSPAAIDGNIQLNVIFWLEPTIQNVLLKLRAFEAIYQELAVLLELSPSDHPLYVVRMESGSFSLDLQAIEKLIDLLRHILDGAFGWYYRNKTTEGKIEAIPRKVAALESVIGLREKLHANGIQTADMDERLSKASVVVAQRLTELLEGEAQIKIDHKVYSVSLALEEKLLVEGRQRLLPEGSGVNSGERAKE
jgi:hypothetical protein